MKALRLTTAVIMPTLFLAGCDSSPRPATKALTRAEAKARLAQINSLHERSCMCRLAGRNDARLARRLGIAKDGLAVEGADAGAIPVGHSVDCYPELGRSACVTTYSLSTSVGGGEVCTSDQWREIEDVFDTNGGTSGKAKIAVEKRMAEMRQAAEATVTQTACD